jgi:hypothetical protein
MRNAWKSEAVCLLAASYLENKIPEKIWARGGGRDISSPGMSYFSEFPRWGIFGSTVSDVGVLSLRQLPLFYEKFREVLG